MRILVVEPDEYYHSLLAQTLDFSDLHLACDARAARAFLEESTPDAVIVELLLPDEPGYVVLQELRHHPLVPVIVFSQVSHVGDIEASMALGANAYFVKGVDSVNEVRKLLLNYV